MALPRVLVTEPLPESATKAVLHPLRAPWVPSWAPIPARPAARHPLHCGTGVGTSSAAAPARAAAGERGLAHTWGVTGCTAMPPTPVRCRAAPTPAPCSSVTKSTIPGEEQSWGQWWQLCGRSRGNTHTAPAGSEGRGDAHAGTDRRTAAGRGRRRSRGSRVPLAHALVRVDVGLAVGTRVCHVLEVIEQAGDQAAAEITPGAEITHRERQRC